MESSISLLQGAISNNIQRSKCNYTSWIYTINVAQLVWPFTTLWESENRYTIANPLKFCKNRKKHVYFWRVLRYMDSMDILLISNWIGQKITSRQQLKCSRYVQISPSSAQFHEKSGQVGSSRGGFVRRIQVRKLEARAPGPNFLR